MANESDDAEWLTEEAIDRDCWNSVFMPLPEKPDPDLVNLAHWVAEYCYDAARSRLEHADWQLMAAHEPLRSLHPKYDQPGGHSEYMEAALERLEELEKIDPTLLRMGIYSEHYAQQMEDQPARSPDIDAGHSPEKEHDENRDQSITNATPATEMSTDEKMARLFEDDATWEADKDLDIVEDLNEPDFDGSGLDRGGR